LKFNIQIVCIFSIVRIESAYVMNEPSVITVRITIVAKIIMSIINFINALPTLTLFIYCEKIYYVLQKNEPNKCNIFNLKLAAIISKKRRIVRRNILLTYIQKQT